MLTHGVLHTHLHRVTLHHTDSDRAARDQYRKIILKRTAELRTLLHSSTASGKRLACDATLPACALLHSHTERSPFRLLTVNRAARGLHTSIVTLQHMDRNLPFVQPGPERSSAGNSPRILTDESEFTDIFWTDIRSQEQPDINGILCSTL